MNFKVIARIHTDFKEKFGIPRQSGILEKTFGKIVFEPEYRRTEALRGLEGFSHIWLLWEFSESLRDTWSPTVRPPRLGGNKRVGVFATRSPYRPNPIGLSAVKLEEIRHTENEGDVLIVSGADILDGTPIYDIKPYLKFADSKPDAICGFSDEALNYKINVNIPEDMLKKVEESKRQTLLTLLENDPRPAYKSTDEKEYGMSFSDYEIFFQVKNGVLTVTKIKNSSDVV